MEEKSGVLPITDEGGIIQLGGHRRGPDANEIL